MSVQIEKVSETKEDVVVAVKEEPIEVVVVPSVVVHSLVAPSLVPVKNKWIEPGATRPSCSNCYGKEQWNDDECSFFCEKLRPFPSSKPVNTAERGCLEVHYLYKCWSCGEEPPPYDPTKKPRITPLPYGLMVGLGDAPAYQREAMIKYLEERKHQPCQ